MRDAMAVTLQDALLIVLSAYLDRIKDLATALFILNSLLLRYNVRWLSSLGKESMMF